MARSRRILVLLGASLLACGATTEDRDLRGDGVRVLEAHFAMDCMPVHGADTAHMSIRVEYTNTTSEPREWHLASGRLELSRDELHGTLRFPIQPSTSGLVAPGETVDAGGCLRAARRLGRLWMHLVSQS